MLASPHTNWPELLPYVMRAINCTVSRATGMDPYLLFFGETTAPLHLEEAPLTAPDVGEMPAVALQLYLRRLQRDLAALRAAARRTEAQYLQQMTEEYRAHPVRGTDSEAFARAQPHPELPPGTFVIVKRPRLGPWATKSAGPYIVLEERNNSVLLLSLASGRECTEDKTNCRALRGWINL